MPSSALALVSDEHSSLRRVLGDLLRRAGNFYIAQFPALGGAVMERPLSDYGFDDGNDFDDIDKIERYESEGVDDALLETAEARMLSWAMDKVL